MTQPIGNPSHIGNLDAGQLGPQPTFLPDDHPDVVDAARRLREGHDAVVVLGRRLPAVLVRQIVQSGIDAVVSKRAGIDELLAVVRRTAAGEDHVDPRLAATVLRAEACPLTARERDVLRLVERSLSTRRCAAELHLAEGTVRNLISSGAIGNVYRTVG